MTTTWFRPSDLPDEWRSVPLRRVGRVLNGGTPAADPSNWGGEIPFVTPPDLNGVDGAVLKSTGRTLSKSGAKGAGLAPAGSVLVSTRAPIGHVGRVAEKSAFNQGCRAVAPQEGTDPRYVAAVLVAARAELTARGQGTTFFELSSSAFASILTPLPPLDEQRAIADYLDQETARIDALVVKQQEFIGLLGERRDAAWASGLDRAIEERRPVPLRRVITSIVDGPFGSSLTSAHYSDSGTRVIRLGNIGTNSFRAQDEAYIPDSYAEQLVGHDARRGDVVIAGLGDESWPLGRAAVVPEIGPAIVKADCFRVRPAPRVSGEYLAWALSAPQTRSQVALLARGSTRKRINTSIARAIEIPVPPLECQKSILEASTNELSRIDTLIAKAEDHIALAKERRAALITAAVTGKIDVRTARKAG